MTENKQFPRPDIKIVNTQTGIEEIKPMPDDEYAVWLEECLKFAKNNSL